MKREILFKAKCNKRGIWWIGDLLTLSGRNTFAIRTIHGQEVLIDRETVCQFTGLLDKNGVKIFEGDKVLAPDWYDSGYAECVIIFLCGRFCVSLEGGSIGINEWGYENEIKTPLEVIGNIHDD